MHSETFVLSETMRDYKSEVAYIRKLCDYAQLFSKINRQLIEEDKDKKARGKRTRRYPISKVFVRATECLERIHLAVNTLKVQSLSEVKHNQGTDLPYEEQNMVKPENLRSVHVHFLTLNEMERQFIDVRQYKVELLPLKMQTNPRSPTPNQMKLGASS